MAKSSNPKKVGPKKGRPVHRTVNQESNEGAEEAEDPEAARERGRVKRSRSVRAPGGPKGNAENKAAAKRSAAAEPGEKLAGAAPKAKKDPAVQRTAPSGIREKTKSSTAKKNRIKGSGS